MKKANLLFLLTVLLLHTSGGESFAGAWTAPQGSFYEKLGFNYYYSHESFDPKGGRTGASAAKFSDYNLTNYFEYGVTNDLTVINSLTYKWLESTSGAAKTSADGLGDVDLGVRYKLFEGSAGIFSTQALVKVPGAYGQSDPLPLGNGQFDTELRLLFGRSLYPFLPGYANVEAGYRFRAAEPSDEIRYLVELGFDITKDLYTRGKLDGILCMNNGVKRNSSGNPTAANNYDLGKLDLALGWKVTPSLGVEIGYRPDIYGQNTAAGANYSFAVYYKTP